jgi:S-DNA-T family DNA segregation ATPase FtsK/SpoIIIE
VSYRVIHRPARTTRPARMGEKVNLESPPVIDQSAGKVNLLTIVPLLGAATSMTVMMLFRGSPFAAVGALMMIVTVLASVVLLFTQRGKARRDREVKRDSYLEYLDEKRREFALDDERVKAETRVNSPEFEALSNVALSPSRIWERRRGQRDFLRTRLGIGDRPVRDIRISSEDRAIERPDYFLQTEAEGVRKRYRTAPGLPCEFSLDSRGEVTVIGPLAPATSIARNIICRSAVLHSPEDVELALVVPEGSREEWEWASGLPHLAEQGRPTPLGPVKRIYTSCEDLVQDLRGNLVRRARAVAEAKKNNRQVDVSTLLPSLVVIDLSGDEAVTMLESPDSTLTVPQLGVTAVRFLDNRLNEPDEVAARFTLSVPDALEEGEGFEVLYEELDRDDDGESFVFSGEWVTTDQAETVARVVTPLRLSPDSLEHNEAANSVRYTEMLGLADLDKAEIERKWRPRSEQDFLRIPLGPDDAGKPVLLDLKESAQLGMGPHGLCVGATGAGKSELLRTIVLALMTTHSPELLNMVLVDFKGGATFAPFEGAPHVNGIITNLAEDPSLIDRAHDSLAGEVRRRQEVLKQAGNIANVTDYEMHRQEAAARGEDWAPLPHLLVIIDEFGELLTAQPDFIDLFLSIGRIGRSIGVHLMLSSQRIESGKLRGLDTYLSYRLGLRTLSEMESRTVLDTPDAFHLPAVPGYGYLKVDTTVYDRFKAGFVSGPLENLTSDPAIEEPRRSSVGVLPAPFYVEDQRALAEQLAEHEPLEKSSEETEHKGSERTTGTTVMSHLVDVLKEFPRATQEIWLPPLPQSMGLDAVTGEPQATTEGFVVAAGGELQLPVGFLDDPSRQWQGVWFLDLTRAGGNVSLVGGPHTGKTTALRTIALSASLTHRPDQLAIYGIDLKGSSLLSLERLPHVGGVGVRTVRERVRRTIEEVHAMLVEREEVFERHGIDSLETFRRKHAAGEVPELPVADVLLLIDGYGQIADEFEEIETQTHEILARGGGYGIHVIATSTRANEVRIAQQAFFGNKIEFRLTEPSESVFGKKKGESLPVGRPGRALRDDGLIGHFAVPRCDGEASATGLSEAFEAVAREVNEHHDAGAVPPVRVLPPVLTADRIDVPERQGAFALGLQEKDFRTRSVNLFGRDRHLMIMGDALCGKTNLLRSAMQSLVDGADPEELVLAVFDPRQELEGVVPDEFLGGHAKSSLLAQKLAQSIKQELVTRVPNDPNASGPTEPPSPKIVLVIDDYDVLTAGSASPLADLAPYVSMAHEIGLHVIMTRKVAGAARGLFDTFNAAVRESGASTFLMDGDRTEGALVNGIRPRHFPPGRGMFVQGGRAPVTVQAVFDPEQDKENEDYE